VLEPRLGQSFEARLPFKTTTGTELTSDETETAESKSSCIQPRMLRPLMQTVAQRPGTSQNRSPLPHVMSRSHAKGLAEWYGARLKAARLLHDLQVAESNM